ncbi:MAG: tetratricopeptide repeat protein [Calditrichaeota bacterium]|nr:MAG: tetratricopeptide repeat protein [Calditrichota bacterium]
MKKPFYPARLLLYFQGIIFMNNKNVYIKTKQQGGCMNRIIIVVGILLMTTSCAWFKSEPKPEITEPEVPDEALLVKAEDYVSEGISYFQSGKDSLAISSWNKALEIIPEDAEVYNYRGIALHRTGNVTKALEDFESATNLNPNYYEAHNNRGYMLFLLDRYNEALSAFSKALNINPNYEPAQKNRKLVQNIALGNLRQEAFDLGEKIAGKDDYEEQIPGYRKVLELDSTYAKGHNNLGAAYYYAGNLDSAYYHIRKAIHYHKDYPEAINNLAILYKANGDYETAIKLFLKALALKPKYISALNNLGDTYSLKNEKQNAERVYKTVLELDPENVEAKEGLKQITLQVE